MLPPTTIPTFNTTDHFFPAVEWARIRPFSRVGSVPLLLSFPGGQLWADSPPTWVSRTTHLGKQTPQQPWTPASDIIASGALE